MAETDPTPIELQLTGPAGDGASVGRDRAGRVVFVEAGLPGERVLVQLTKEKKRFARGRVIDILEPSPGRRVPACSTGRAGCGGCDLAHAVPELQLDLKSRHVVDVLARIGGVEVVPVPAVRAVPPSGYRTTVRTAVVEGRAGYRRRWSHDVVTATECLVAHPLVEELLVEGRWGSASEVTIRVSAATGERIAIVDGELDGVEVPDGVNVVARASASLPSAPAIVEHAAGRDWRVSAGSFFQSGPMAIDALVGAVGEALGPEGCDHLLDAYCGVGIFASAIGAAAERVTAVESSAPAVRDARWNLGSAATVVRSPVEDWTPTDRVDVVIADPSRAGLGERAATVLAATGAARFVLVSCDVGAMGRDVGLLRREGFEIASVAVVDAFPDTSHVETVVGLTR